MKTIRFIAIIIVSAVVAMGVAIWVDSLGVFHYRLSFVTVFTGTAMGLAALLGAFHYEENKSGAHYEDIKHRVGFKDAA